MELVLNFAKAIGCVVVNVGAKHLIEGRITYVYYTGHLEVFNENSLPRLFEELSLEGGSGRLLLLRQEISLLQGKVCSFPSNVKRREARIAEKWQRAEALAF